MDYENKLSLLEDLHIQFQQDSIRHFVVHFRMLDLAVRYRQWNEVIGQIPRLLLAIPGSILGLAPKGNVGSTKMGIFEKAD